MPNSENTNTQTAFTPVVEENQSCLRASGGYDCFSRFNCCNCGTQDQDNGCGCRYCFACQACDYCRNLEAE